VVARENNEGREKGMEMPREHGRETYESEAALRALRGISQVAVSPTASTGFNPPFGSRITITTSKNHVETVEFTAFAAMLYYALFVPGCRQRHLKSQFWRHVFRHKGRPKNLRFLFEQICCIFKINNFFGGLY